MNENCLVLFIYEVALLKDIEFFYTKEGEYMIEYPFGENIIEPMFIRHLNNFMEGTYQENKELIQLMFNNLSLLEEFIKNKYAILDYKTLLVILSHHRGMSGYLHLLESIDIKTNEKLNELAVKFLNYYDELLEMYNEEYTGYKKILQ